MSTTSATLSGSQSPSLPKIPKVLSVIANSVNSQWEESARVYMAQISMDGDDGHSSQTTNKAVNNSSMTDQAKSMSASLALLRKEMSSLRQLDGYLLCRLMSLHSAISEYKSQEDDIMFSESSTDLIIEDDDELVDDVILPVPSGRVTII